MSGLLSGPMLSGIRKEAEVSDFPRPIAGGNTGDGLPLVLGDDTVVGDLFTGASAAHVLDWDGDGQHEIIASGGNGGIYSYRIVDSMADGPQGTERESQSVERLRGSRAGGAISIPPSPLIPDHPIDAPHLPHLPRFFACHPEPANTTGDEPPSS